MMQLMQFAEWLREPRHAAALGAGLSAAMVLRWCLQPKIDRFRVVPGVWLLGVLPQLGPGGKDTAKKLDEFSEIHGDEGVFEMNLAGSRLVVCCSWEAISSVLALRPFKVTKPGSLASAAHGVVEGVFFSEGDRWKRERRIMAPAFNAKNVGSYAPAISEITEKFLAALDADCKSKGETNFSELLPMYTADVLCKTAFGQELRMLETRDSSLVKDSVLEDSLPGKVPGWRGASSQRCGEEHGRSHGEAGRAGRDAGGEATKNGRQV
ncbi:Cyp4d1 [Symbiodinium sp. CCMP2456]|nr:Cyp4d1 [Symbiodinium sp. CCMP2456]